MRLKHTAVKDDSGHCRRARAFDRIADALHADRDSVIVLNCDANSAAGVAYPARAATAGGISGACQMEPEYLLVLAVAAPFQDVVVNGVKKHLGPVVVRLVQCNRAPFSVRRV